MKLKYYLCLIALASALPVVAQYQWIDANGRKVFSDQPPPDSVPLKKVVQQPSKPVSTQTSTTVSASSSAASAAPSTSATYPKSMTGDGKTNGDKPGASATKSTIPTTDKELEAKKKAADEAEAAKKKAEDEKQAKAKADNCERAKRAKASLDSGVRISTTNSKGEREFMDEAARMVETKRIQGIMQADCK